MKKTLLSIIWLTSVCVACTSQNPNLRDQHWVSASETLGIVYIPPTKEIYVEYSVGSRRNAEPQSFSGVKLAANLFGASLGTWAGYASAAASAPANAAVAVNPVALAAMVVVPVTIFAIDKVKEAQARKLAMPFLDIEHPKNTKELVQQSLQDEMLQSQNLGFSGYQYILATSADSKRDVDEIFEELGSDKILVITSIAAFTPKFEAIDLKLIYAVVEQSTERTKAIYTNAVIVQSTLRSGLDGTDTRNEIEQFSDRVRTEKLADLTSRSRGRNFKPSQLKMARKVIEKKARWRREAWQKSYETFDNRDPKGTMWLADDAKFFKQELKEVYKEAIRIMHQDLLFGGISDLGTKARPPGFNKQMQIRPDLASNDRDVYQFSSKALVSINKKSRMIPTTFAD